MVTWGNFRLGRTSLLVSIVLFHAALAYMLTQQRMPSGNERESPPAASAAAPMFRPITVAPGQRTRESGVQSRPLPQDGAEFELRGTFAPVYILPGAQPEATPLPESARRLSQTDPAGEIEGPKILNRVLPDYPTDSIRVSEEGAVRLSTPIDETGNASDWKVVSSSGSARLDSAALTAASEWKLAPAMRAARPITSSGEVEFRFKLYPITFSLIEEASPSASSSATADARSSPRGEAALRDLIAASKPLIPYPEHEKRAQHDAIPLTTALATWGSVSEIKFLRFHGSQKWQTYPLKPEYRAVPDTVVIRWESYEVNHERLTSAWRVAVDEAGRIWAVKAGVAPWHD